jgi:hypothetical protein
MGLLDDAIREHLDLKRRRGADPSEIERAEREALGPVRRDPEPVAEDAGTDQALPYDDRADAGWEDEPYEEEPGYEPRYETQPAPSGELYDDDDEYEEEPDAEEPPPAPRFSPQSRFAERDLPDEDEPDPFGEEPPPSRGPEGTPPPHPASARPVPGAVGDETVEFTPAEAGAAASDEDVLEETPEFLQDTPDHDRLWFEQRPPRDFDFDG